jgi:hypothetical protein
VIIYPVRRPGRDRPNKKLHYNETILSQTKKSLKELEQKKNTLDRKHKQAGLLT